ncbi:MAG: GxxExxY protein [Gemmatimonas sp.]|nr:GxxExxY protein [Gemmatimonas sp.]
MDALRPIHQAQLLTYLKLGGWTVGLLINFNVPVLVQGVKRMILGSRPNPVTNRGIPQRP